MDPVSHLALGRALAALADGREPRRGRVAAALTGALMPDADAVFMPFGWDRYLRAHDAGTHAIVGTLGCAVLAAAAVKLVVRDASWRSVLLMAWLGAAGHVLLDVLSSARIRLFWPFLDHHVSVPLVAMADPWLAAILAAIFPAAWLARRHQRAAAAVLLAAAAVFLSVKGVRAAAAIDRYLAARDAGSPADFIVEAQWASLDAWWVFERTATSVRGWQVGAHAPPRLVMTWPIERGSSPADHTPAVRNFTAVHELAFRVAAPTSAEPRLLWSDPRFCWVAPAAEAPALDPTVVRGERRLSCALWVGAALDDEGRPIRQIVRVFGLDQDRGL